MLNSKSDLSLILGVHLKSSEAGQEFGAEVANDVMVGRCCEPGACCTVFKVGIWPFCH